VGFYEYDDESADSIKYLEDLKKQQIVAPPQEELNSMESDNQASMFWEPLGYISEAEA
jgi:hypothetical protein